MSTRYVWGKYNYGNVFKPYKIHNNSYSNSTIYYLNTGSAFVHDSGYEYGADDYLRIVLCNNFTCDKSTGRIIPSDIVFDVKGTVSDNQFKSVFASSQTTPTGRFLFYFNEDTGYYYNNGYFVQSPEYYLTGESITVSVEPETFITWSMPGAWTLNAIKSTMYPGQYSVVCTSHEVELRTNKDDESALNYPLLKRICTTTFEDKTTLIGNVASASSSTYPTDGISSSYWYYYQGADNIDPKAITCTTPIAGSSATIAVTPSTSNVYGGTISYTYQYSTDGGSTWTTIATSSNTNYSFIIPTSATTLAVRANASDSYGFTSSTYATSSNYTVNYPVYASVSGVVKGVNSVVAVGGGVRTAKATACKDGVIKTL